MAYNVPEQAKLALCYLPCRVPRFGRDCDRQKHAVSNALPCSTLRHSAELPFEGRQSSTSGLLLHVLDIHLVGLGFHISFVRVLFAMTEA